MFYSICWNKMWYLKIKVNEEREIKNKYEKVIHILLKREIPFPCEICSWCFLPHVQNVTISDINKTFSLLHAGMFTGWIQLGLLPHLIWRGWSLFSALPDLFPLENRYLLSPCKLQWFNGLMFLHLVVKVKICDSQKNNRKAQTSASWGEIIICTAIYIPKLESAAF